MSKRTNSAFVEALRRLGKPTSIDDLRRLGTARFRTVRSSDISLLIERALNRTLPERTIGPVSAEQRMELQLAAEEHFARQLARSRGDRANGEDVDAPHRSASRLDEARLAREILDCLKPLLVFVPPEGIAREVAGTLRGLIELHVAEQLAESDRHVALLAARLERTERALARLSGELEAEFDGELASGWRASLGGGSAPAEGPTEIEAERPEQRRELMARLLEANLELRSRA